MSHSQALKEMAGAFREEFTQPITYCPMLRLPNSRPTPDPNKPAYETCGIVDKNCVTNTRPHTSKLRSGKGDAVDIPSIQPCVSMHECDLKYPPNQGDEIIITHTGDKYRVLHSERGNTGITRLLLEQLGRPEMS